MNEAAMATSVKSIDDARRVLRDAAANLAEQGALRALLKETVRSSTQRMTTKKDLDDEVEKEIARALRGMVFELKSMRA